MRRWALCASCLTALLAGCFSPSYSECPFACARSRTCPAGYTCDPARALCCRSGAPPADLRRELSSDLRDLPLEGPTTEGAPVRELAASFDSDAEWATGQLTRTQAKSGLLQLTLPTSSSKRGPKTVVDVDSGQPWYHLSGGNPVFDPSVLAQGTPVIADLSQNQVSRILHLTGFGFALPPGALVDGVLLEVTRAQSGSVSQIKDELVQLLVKGARSGADRKSGSYWTQATATAAYGGSGDSWGLALDAATVGAADFGCALRVRSTYAGNASAWIKSTPQLTVHLTDATGEWSSPLVSLGPGAKRWDSLESKQDAGSACGIGPILYDVLDESGQALLSGLVPGAVTDLSALSAPKLRLRARLRTASKSCLPTIDLLRLFQRR